MLQPATAQLTFTIAATDYALRAIAVPFLVELKAKAPHIQVSLIPVDDKHLQVQLEKGNIDLALVTPESALPNLHARNLFQEEYVCVVRDDHPVLKKGNKLTIEQFCALDHALVSNTGGQFRGVTDSALEKLGKQRTVTLSVKSFLILPEILRASDMIAVLPSRLVEGLSGLVIFPPPIEVPGFTKTAVWHERTHRDNAQQWMRNLLFEVCTDKSH